MSCNVLRRRCGPEPVATAAVTGNKCEALLPKLGKVKLNKEPGLPSQSTNFCTKFEKPFFSMMASKSIV